MRHAFLFWILFALPSCTDPLKKSQIIEEPRVLAARAEVVGAPERATPEPGETLRVRWLVVAPEVDPPAGYAFELCARRPTSDGRASCENPPFAAPRADAPVPNPAFDTLVLDVGSARDLALFGVICANGAPRAGSNAGCASGTTLPTELRISLRHDGVDNLNPSLANATLWFDGAPWDESTALGTCQDLPRVSPRTAHVLALAPDANDRETLGDGTRETLLISHFSDGGELSRASSVIEADAPDNAEISLHWHSGDAPAEGRVARFFFVLRDLRGGVDFAERRVCVAA